MKVKPTLIALLSAATMTLSSGCNNRGPLSDIISAVKVSKKSTADKFRASQPRGDHIFYLNPFFLNDYPEFQESSGLPEKDIPPDVFIANSTYIIRSSLESEYSRLQSVPVSELSVIKLYHYHPLYYSSILIMSFEQCIHHLAVNGGKDYTRFISTEEDKFHELIKKLIDYEIAFENERHKLK